VGLTNNQGGTPTEVGVPQLSLPEPRLPLVPPANAVGTARTVVVTNAQLPVSAVLRVDIRTEVGGQIVTASQGSPTILSGQGNSTVVGFELQMQPIVAAIGNPAETADLAGELLVLVDDSQIADPLPVELLRQPIASLEGASQVFLSPLGGTSVTLRVNGLRATTTGDLQMYVTTADPNSQGAQLTRLCTSL